MTSSHPTDRSHDDRARRLMRLESLFDAALAVPETQRDAFLRRVRADDSRLADDLAQLIADASAKAAWWEHPAAHIDASAAPPAATEWIDRRIGPFRIDAYVASGGMADVFRGSRVDAADGTTGPVAIKLLRRGLDSDALLARFRREHRTLARLHHPHIVAWIAAGALPDGRPWLAMEYVDGEPIDAWCRCHAAGLATRLALFTKVCDAVQFAHNHLVVHRDLKPSNLLVTTHGEPKLLDFGVARLLAPHDDDEDVTDANGPVPLTPAWASPEQLAGAPATTASDVHALGLLLRALVRDCADGSTRLRADLTAIERTARHEDPTRRYATAEGLAADIARARTGLPLRAHPDGVRYRARRFVGRHPVAVVGAAALALGALLGSVGLYVGMRNARSEAGIGWKAHREAVDVARMLEDLVRTTQDGTLESALDALAQRLPELQESPEAEGRMRLTLGALYADLGRFDAARAHLTRGLELARSHRGFDRRTIDTGVRRLADLPPESP